MIAQSSDQSNWNASPGQKRQRREHAAAGSPAHVRAPEPFASPVLTVGVFPDARDDSDGYGYGRGRSAQVGKGSLEGKGERRPPEYQFEIGRGLTARGILRWCGPTPKAIEAAPLRDRIARSSA